MQKSVQVRTPLYAAAYWQQAADEFKNIRVLAFAGMVTALAIILESFPIYLLGQSLKIYFSFVVVSLGCACYGPLVGMGVGAVIDTLGFLLSSYGEPYFPGYLITAMLSGLIYGVMLYQRKPTIPRLIVTPSADQLRQQCAAGQCVESYVVWQGLPVLPEHRHGQKHHHDPH